MPMGSSALEEILTFYLFAYTVRENSILLSPFQIAGENGPFTALTLTLRWNDWQ